MEAVRGYLRELRIGRQVSQDELADVMGLSRKGLIDWEMGRTEDIKTGVMIRALQYLKGAIEDIGLLMDASIEEGIKLARMRIANPDLQFTEEQRQRLEQVANSIPDEQVDEAIDLLETLQRQNKTKEWLNFGRFLKNAG